MTEPAQTWPQAIFALTRRGDLLNSAKRAPPCAAAGNQCFPKASLMNEHLTTQPVALPFLNEISYSSRTMNSLGVEIDPKKQNSISEPPSRRMASWKGHGIWKATGLHMGLRASWLCGLGHITVLGPRPFTSEEEIMNSTSLTWGEVKVKLSFKMAVKWSPPQCFVCKRQFFKPDESKWRYEVNFLLPSRVQIS